MKKRKGKRSGSRSSRAAPTSASPTCARGRVTLGDVLPRPASRPIPADSPSTRSRVTASASRPTPATASPTCRRRRSRTIFSGRVRNWSRGRRATGKTGAIDLVVRHRRLRYAGRVPEHLHGQHLRVASAQPEGRPTASWQQAIRVDPNAIGYLASRSPRDSHDVSYQGVACSLRNAKSGQYPGSRNFWLVTRGAPTAPASQPRSTGSSRPARKIIARTGCPQASPESGRADNRGRTGRGQVLRPRPAR